MKAEILYKSQQQEFDRPPKFNLVERRTAREYTETPSQKLVSLYSLNIN
jgi:hypothetical protein